MEAERKANIEIATPARGGLAKTNGSKIEAEMEAKLEAKRKLKGSLMEAEWKLNWKQT